MFFKIIHQSKKSKARTGILKTLHGTVHTPTFVPVATKGTLKSIPPADFKAIGVQLAFVNTYHLTLHPGPEVLKAFGGIHTYAKLPIPLMSDSAGFQIFSLANKRATTRTGEEAILLSITDEQVRFRSSRKGGEIITFTPEISMRNQAAIGADLLMAFDECIYYGASYEYTKRATDRTHAWLLRSIKELKKIQKNQKRQFLYGIIQGGVYKDLREQSAQVVAQQDIDGIAIGGVSVGETKKEMRDQVRWVTPYLPKEKPVHLLGIGRIEDILDFVGEGIDSFDCVEPSRLARNGVVYQWQGKSKDILKQKVTRLDLTRAKYKRDRNPISKGCACYACKNFSLSFLHHLFREKELFGYYLATHHNLTLFSNLFEDLRSEIRKGTV